MIHLKHFTNEHAIINGWLERHNKKTMTFDEVPEIGFVSYFNEIPVACAFLRMVEGGFALLDSLATNPELPGFIRNDAIDCVVDACISQAKTYEMKHLAAYTVEESILKRSEKFGFIKLPHSLISLSLED